MTLDRWQELLADALRSTSGLDAARTILSATSQTGHDVDGHDTIALIAVWVTWALDPAGRGELADVDTTDQVLVDQRAVAPPGVYGPTVYRLHGLEAAAVRLLVVVRRWADLFDAIQLGWSRRLNRMLLAVTIGNKTEFEEAAEDAAGFLEGLPQAVGTTLVVRSVLQLAGSIACDTVAMGRSAVELPDIPLQAGIPDAIAEDRTALVREVTTGTFNRDAVGVVTLLAYGLEPGRLMICLVDIIQYADTSKAERIRHTLRGRRG